MSDLIKVKRGQKINLPSLALGEIGYTTDTEELYIGGSNDNVRIGGKSKFANVDDYGAKGDGLTDDTLSFVNALSLNDVVFTSKEKVYLVGDVDLISKTLTGYGTIKKKSESESALHVKGDGSKIRGLTFSGQPTNGQPSTDIKLGEGSKNIRINNCTFKSNIYSAISGAIDTLQGGTPYIINVNGVIINDNIFIKDPTQLSGYARPIYMHSIKNIKISNNIIMDTDFDAIRLRENTGYCVIDGNLFENIGDPNWVDTQTRDAVDAFWSGDTLTISNNIVKVTAYAGFDIKGVAIDNSHKTRKVIITSNHIEKTRFTGIFVRGGENYNGLGNYEYSDSFIISDNIIEGCNQEKNPTDGYGIRVEGMIKYLNVHDNMVISCYGRGIFINNTSQDGEINKIIKVSGNICINNGLLNNQGSGEAGISIQGVESLMVTDNICENDTDYPNPYQATGIFVQSESGVFTPFKTAIVSGNICRNNTVAQLKIESSNSRANNIAVFRDNIQEGIGAFDRPTWQNQRSEFWGTNIPAVGDGIFRQGDVINNILPIELGVALDKYIINAWKRISVDGSTHVLNTDWVELRALTGN